MAPLAKEDANKLYRIIERIEGIAGRGAAQIAQPKRAALAKELTAINESMRSSPKTEVATPATSSIWSGFFTA